MTTLVPAAKIPVFLTKTKGRPSPVGPTCLLDGGSTICVGADRELAGLDQHTLAVQWRAKVGALTPLDWVGPDILLIGDSRLRLWSPATRTIRWETKVPYNSGARCWEDVIVSMRSDDRIELLERETGALRSAGPVPKPHATFKTVIGDKVVCKAGPDDPILGLQLPDLRVAWSRDLQRETGAGLSFARGASIPGRFLATRGAATFACSLEDGRLLWRADVDVPYHWPRAIAGRIPVLSWRGRFVILDEADGRILVDWTSPRLDDVFRQKPGVPWGDNVVFVSESGHVALFSLASGELLALEKYPASFWQAAVMDGRLLATATDRHVWVFETGTEDSGRPRRLPVRR